MVITKNVLSESKVLIEHFDQSVPSEKDIFAHLDT